MKPLCDRWIDAESRSGQWLADGNAAKERGDLRKAEKCYDKAQFWLDRANILRENILREQIKIRISK